MEFGLVALWIVIFVVLGGMAAPLTTWLVGRRGATGLSFALALVVLTAVGHLVGHVAMGWPAALAGITVLAGLSLYAYPTTTIEWRAFGEATLVFLAGFLLIVVIRGMSPAAAPLPLAIGEKLLDFGLLATLERSATLPPEDMWFAGEHVVYHYGGHLTTSLVSSLTGTPPRFAYNLGLAGFYAALVAAAYGVAGMIANEYSESPRLAGVLGAFFVGIAGNLHTAAQLSSWILPDDVERWVLSLIGADSSVAGWTPAEIGTNWYFGASRVIPANPTADDPFMAATEFPLFAWLNGDLHAHMMSQPAVLLAVGLLFAYWCHVDAPTHRRLLLFGALPVVTGIVGFTNVWSFPTIGGLTLLTVWFAPGNPGRLVPARIPDTNWIEPRSNPWIEEGRRIGLAIIGAIIVLGLGVMWTFPFWFGVVLDGPSRSLALWEPWTPLGGFLVHLGAFLLVFVPFLASRGWRVLHHPIPVFAGIGIFSIAAFTFGAPALGLFLPMLIGAWWLLRTRVDTGFETVLLVAGLGLILIVEVVTIEGERFNVIFKPYVEVWLFWAVSAAVVLTRMVEGWPSTEWSVSTESWQRWSRVLVAVLVVSTGLYGAIAIPLHLDSGSQVTDDGGPTLDGTAFLEVTYPREAPAIRWLNERVGQPTIVTDAPGGYWWRPRQGDGASAPASLTGIPTVLGWFHERQYRGPDAYERRLQAVQTLYGGENPEQQATLLREYDVRFVYVGPAERASYHAITIGEVPGVVVERQWDGVTIYRVDQDRLPS